MKEPKARILVVDDDPRIRRVISTTLKVQGYDVDECESGELAMGLARNQSYALILLDFNLPGISGADTCRELRKDNGDCPPIIMLTVRDATEDKVEALDAGALDYITKPFAMGELLARIRAVLRRTVLPAPGISNLKLGDVDINFSARRVTVKGQPTRLTPKEFDLLLYLTSHRNKTITHRELLREVWGPENIDNRKYLRVFVNRLRKKIEAEPNEPRYLLTEPFVGYRLQIPE